MKREGVLGTFGDWIANHRLPIKSVDEFPSLFDGMAADEEGREEIAYMMDDVEKFGDPRHLERWHQLKDQFMEQLKEMCAE